MFSLHICKCTIYVPCSCGGQMFLYPPQTGVTQGFELPWRCWESNQGPLQWHQVLLTTKPSLQPLTFFYCLLPTYFLQLCYFCLWISNFLYFLTFFFLYLTLPNLSNIRANIEEILFPKKMSVATMKTTQANSLLIEELFITKCSF